VKDFTLEVRTSAQRLFIVISRAYLVQQELRGLDLGFRYTPNLSTNSTSLKHNDHEMDNQEKRIFDPNTYAEEKGVDVKKSYPYRGLGIKISTLDEFLDALPDSFKNIEVIQALSTY
jgi:hypothetical protein